MGGGQVSIPKTNYTQQLTQTLKGQQQTAGGYFGLNQQYAGPYTDLNLQTLDRTLFGDRNAPGELGLQSAAYGLTRASDIGDVLNLGPVGYAALFRSNPGLAMSLINANMQGARTFGPGSLMSRLQDTAGQQLDLGGSLSPEELNMINQGTRSGQAARGIIGSTPALGAELLARDQYSQARLGQRIGYATGVENLALSDRNYLNELAKLNAGVYDPYSAVLGRSSLLGGGISPLSLMGTTQTQSLFSPTAGQDAFNTNVNAQGAAAIANANNSAAGTNAAIGAGGAIIGGLAIAL